MELATDTKTLAAYSPTSTPLLDVLRPVSGKSRGKPSAGELFFLSSAFMLAMFSVPALRRLAAVSTATHFWLGFVAIPAAALPAAWIIHELGHLVAARLAGFRLVRLALGETFTDNGRAEHKLHTCEAVPAGCMIFEPRKMDRLEGRLFTLFFGGPLASLLSAVLLESWRHWPNHHLAAGPPLVTWSVRVFSASSLLIGIASLLPDVGRRGNFSDGSRLIMLLKNDARATRWTAMIRMQLALGHGEHPRGWDSGWVGQAAHANDGSRDAVTANWLAYLWAAERQDITSATRYLEEALAAPSAASARLRDRLFLEAAIFQAWFRENPEKARSWVEQIHVRKLTAVQQQRITIALLWADGRLFDAWEQMEAYLILLGHLPDAPDRDLAEKSALEWRRQMESRMLTRAWRTMYNVSKEVEGATVSGEGQEIASW
jgi:hypothetical protein